MLPQEVIIVTQSGHVDENMQDLLLTLKTELKNLNIRFTFKQLERLTNWTEAKKSSKVQSEARLT